MYVKKNLLPYKNAIGKTSKYYVINVKTCYTPLFVNCYKCWFWGNQGNNIWEHTILTCNHIYPIFFANMSNILSYLEILRPCALSSNLR